MSNNRSEYTKHRLIPYLLVSVATGVLTGVLIFLFKLAASAVIRFSNEIYAYIRLHPSFLPPLVAGAALVGLAAALLLRFAPDCRGGGIPTAIALLRGLIPFNWIKSIVCLFASAMLTYLCGVPLGNEGPSVQMGTAVGRGAVRVFAPKHPAWNRYIMTGGACAGFAAATGAPVTGIFFAFEEAHRNFTPMIFNVAAMTVITGSATMQLLCSLFHVEYALFGLTVDAVLPLRYLWVAILVGLAAGLAAAGFTKCYRIIRRFVRKTLCAISFSIKIMAIFAGVSLIGFVSADCIGSGHRLVEELFEGYGVWYGLILCFLVRAVLLLVANNADVTGGLFVPTLAFGAIIGALCGRALTASGLLPGEYAVIMVIIGMSAFLGASSRTPIMAITFSIEALCGLNNLLPIVLGVTFAFLVVEALGIKGFSETVIESKAETTHAGKTARIVDTHLRVAHDAFAVGKEIRDVLWPPTCVVLSVQKNPQPGELPSVGLAEGDVLHVHYQTYDLEQTMESLEALVGAQEVDPAARVRVSAENHQVPEY